MKNVTSVSALLGLTHQQMAMLLNVGTTHYSMFECGKRDLPLQAQQLLGEMLTYMKSAAAAKKSTTAESQKEWHDHLDRLVRENKYQRMRLEREILSLEKQNLKAQRLEQLSEYLNSHQAGEGVTKGDNTVAKSLLQQLTAKNAGGHFELTLMKLRLRLEFLENESALLQVELKNAKVRAAD